MMFKFNDNPPNDEGSKKEECSNKEECKNKDKETSSNCSK